jgi:tRNA (guanine-N7-)-methyltransferase
VRRFFLNFPDPWFKTRQHKRRVIGPELMHDIHRALAPGGELYVQTDIFDLALEAMSAAESGSPALFENTHAPWSFLPANPYPAKSRRERECEGKGVRVWRLLYRPR